MWRMLQQPQAQDFVLATGETHPVREFVEKCFALLGMEITYVRALHSSASDTRIFPRLTSYRTDGEDLAPTRRASMRRLARFSSRLTPSISVLLKSSMHNFNMLSRASH